MPLIPANCNPIVIGPMEDGRPARPDAGATTGEDARPRLTSQCPAVKKYLMQTLSLALLALLGALAVPTLAQAPASRPSPVDPLPPDTGAAGLKANAASPADHGPPDADHRASRRRRWRHADPRVPRQGSDHAADDSDSRRRRPEQGGQQSVRRLGRAAHA